MGGKKFDIRQGGLAFLVGVVVCLALVAVYSAASGAGFIDTMSRYASVPGLVVVLAISCVVGYRSAQGKQ